MRTTQDKPRHPQAEELEVSFTSLGLAPMVG